MPGCKSILRRPQFVRWEILHFLNSEIEECKSLQAKTEIFRWFWYTTQVGHQVPHRPRLRRPSWCVSSGIWNKDSEPLWSQLCRWLFIVNITTFLQRFEGSSGVHALQSIRRISKCLYVNCTWQWVTAPPDCICGDGQGPTAAAPAMLRSLGQRKQTHQCWGWEETFQRWSE